VQLSAGNLYVGSQLTEKLFELGEIRSSLIKGHGGERPTVLHLSPALAASLQANDGQILADARQFDCRTEAPCELQTILGTVTLSDMNVRLASRQD